MAISFDRKVVLFKAEATEGTDAVPTGGANSIRTLNYSPVFMTSDQKVRNIDTAYYGAKPTLLTGFRRGATFELEMAGSGAATTPPAWMILNRMAAFAAGVAGGSSVVQSRNSSPTPFSHYAAFLNEANSANSLFLKAFGGKASMGFRITDDDFPVFTYSYLGRPPTLLAETSALPAATFAAQVAPVIASSENTTYTLDGYALPLRSAEMNSNADLALRSLIGPADYIAYRNDAWNGTRVAEVPDLATKNYFLNVRSGTTMVEQIVHGTAAGNIVQIDAPAVQISGDITFQEEAGKLMMSMPVTYLPVNGNDDVTFTGK